MAGAGYLQSDAPYRRGAVRTPQICFRALRRRRAYVHRPAFRIYAGEMLRLSFAYDFGRFGCAELPSRLEALADSATARRFALEADAATIGSTVRPRLDGCPVAEAMRPSRDRDGSAAVRARGGA